MQMPRPKVLYLKVELERHRSSLLSHVGHCFFRCSIQHHGFDPLANSCERSDHVIAVSSNDRPGIRLQSTSAGMLLVGSSYYCHPKEYSSASSPAGSPPKEGG